MSTTIKTSLNVLTENTDIGFNVYWKVGSKTQGIIRISVNYQIDDPLIVAELSAIQHLLTDMEVLGEDRAGNGLTIICSLGAIKKLHRGQSTKRQLFPYSNFLRTRFADAEIQISKELDWIQLNKAEKNETRLEISGPLPETINLHGAGLVDVSHHALERFCQRRDDVVEIGRAWRKLRNMAKDNSIRLIEVPDYVKKKEAFKHGSEGLHYYHPGTEWHFVVVREGERQVLSTVYQRKTL